MHDFRADESILFGLVKYPPLKNAAPDLGAFLTPVWGQRPHGVKKLLTGVVSPILSHKSSLRLDLWLEIGETIPANNFLPLWGR